VKKTSKDPGEELETFWYFVYGNPVIVVFLFLLHYSASA